MLLLLLAVVLAPAVMLAATAMERRSGARAAGWVAALPFGLAVGGSVIDHEQGGRAARALVLSAAGHVPAQVAFAACFALVLRRRGLVAGFATATLGYLVVSVALVPVAAAARIGAGAVALVVATVLTRRRGSESRPPRDTSIESTVVTCVSAAVVVGVIVSSSRSFGPVTAGAIAAFPTMTTTLGVSLARRRGNGAVVGVLAGLIRSLPCYLAFAVTIGLTATRLPLGLVLATALAVGTVVAGLMWRTVRLRAAPAT